MSLNSERIFIGVAWPYANGPLHLGHFAGSLLPPDIFARYHRLKGNEVLMVSGSDQHGTPITLQALERKITPREVADEYHEVNSRCIKDMGISFDMFFKTSHENHKKTVKNFLLEIMKNGYLYEKDTTGLYCEKCNRFLPDRYVKGECPYCGYADARGDQCDECGKTFDAVELKNPACKICGSSPVEKKTRHLFFRLSSLQDELKKWIDSNRHWKRLVSGFTNQWFSEGLKDRAITRDLDWGVDVPLEGYEGKKIYVWFEAVIGYLSASMEWARINNDDWDKFWKDPETKHYYFLGKDNIPFHTVIWPSMLMAHGGLNLPYDIPANAYLTLSGEQFSKSRNHAVWIPEYLKRYHPDILRYYLSVNMPENRDNDFTWEMFVEKNNGDLVGTIGNFIHRVLTFYNKNFGIIKTMKDDLHVTEMIENAYISVEENIRKTHFQEAIKGVLHLASEGNRYFAYKAPWDLIKQDRNECEKVMYNSLRIVWALGFLMYPFMPFSADKLLKMLGSKQVEDFVWDNGKKVPDGLSFNKIKPIFVKLDVKEVLEKERGSSDDTVTTVTLKKGKGDIMKDEKITVDDIAKLDLRVGKVIDVKPHPNADKLYVIKVDIGNEIRTIVGGLKKYYSHGELEGKRVIVVANLKSAKLRGIESNGMLLAAEDDNTVSVLTTDKIIKTGSKIR